MAGPIVPVQRWGFAAIGLACFALGAIGAVVPGMPTTVFLLIGSYFLTRSSPALEKRLLDSRLLRPYAEFVRSEKPMSTRARWVAISMMSISVAVSLTVLYLSGRLPVLVLGVILSLWLIGLVSILRFRRRAKVAGPADRQAEPSSASNP